MAGKDFILCHAHHLSLRRITQCDCSGNRIRQTFLGARLETGKTSDGHQCEQDNVLYWIPVSMLIWDSSTAHSSLPNWQLDRWQNKGQAEALFWWPPFVLMLPSQVLDCLHTMAPKGQSRC